MHHHKHQNDDCLMLVSCFLSGPSHAEPAPTKASSRQKVTATPLPGGGVMQTPMPPGWQNAKFGGAFATVVKKAGRGAKTKAGDAIVVTCAGEAVYRVKTSCMLDALMADQVALPELMQSLFQIQSSLAAGIHVSPAMIALFWFTSSCYDIVKVPFFLWPLLCATSTA